MSRLSLPAIPPAVRTVLGFVAFVGVPVVPIVPPPYGGLLAVVVVACGLLSGVAVRVPQWLQGSAILRGSIPAALSPLIYILFQASTSNPDPLEAGGSLLGAVLLSWLAGVPLPQPGQRPASDVVANHANDTAAALGRTLSK
jgi:hypothetical protein